MYQFLKHNWGFLGVLLSFIVVAFGQPAWIFLLSLLSSVAGYAFFWLSLENVKKRVSLSNKAVFITACIWFMLVQAIHLSWMTAIEFQGLYILGVYFILCLWLGLQFAFLTCFVHRLSSLEIAALWTLIEWSRIFILCGFTWNPAGLSLTATTYGSQLLSLFGIFGLSFLVLWTNMALFKKQFVLWAFLCCIPYCFGILHVGLHAPKISEGAYLSTSLVQTGLLPSEKMPFSGREEEFVSPYEQWSRIFKLLNTQKEVPDLIVLPEAAVPFSAHAPMYQKTAVEKIVASIVGPEKAALALSSLEQSDKEPKVSNAFLAQALSNLFSAEVIIGLDCRQNGKNYTSALMVAPYSEQMKIYHKQILVPMGEYIPFEWLKEFTKIYGITEFYTRGAESTVFSGRVPISVAICYEETFSDLVRRGRTGGSELIVSLSNDAWYPFSKLADQHKDHGRIRSIENGVPLLRACNTGVTSAFDSLGRCLGFLETESAGVLSVRVPLYHYRTLYSFWGDGAIILLCLVIMFRTKSFRTSSKRFIN